MEEKKKVLSLIAAKLRFTTYWQILRTMVAVADPWEGPGDPGPPLFLDQTEARRAENNFFEPPLSQGLDDRPPSLSGGLDPPLGRGGGGSAQANKQMTTYQTIEC